MMGDYANIDWKNVKRIEDEIIMKSVFLFVKLKELDKKVKSLEYEKLL